MRAALDETSRRREKQVAYNEAYGIQPFSIIKDIRDITDRVRAHAVAESQAEYRTGADAKLPQNELRNILADLEDSMKTAAQNLEFEKAAALRDQIYELRNLLLEEGDYKPWERIKLLTGK